jgi:DNA-binding response OmpR family regulator
MRVLLIEDARRMADAVKSILEHNNYAVDVRMDGDSGLYDALTDIYDVIILDVMLPKLDGISVLREIRAAKIRTPVLLLTAKGQTEDKVSGLDAGADDYLVKPFEMAELLARLRALVRRTPGMQVTDGQRLVAGDIVLDPGTLTLANGERSFSLTLKESQLLELLMRNKGMTLSVQTIIDKVWGYDADAEDRHVQVYISFLRKKLAALGDRVSIRTLRGLGYLLQVASQAGPQPGADDGAEGA